MLFGSRFISSPSTSENTASQTLSETPGTSISTKKLKLVNGTSLPAMSDLHHTKLTVALHQPHGEKAHRQRRRHQQIDDKAALVDRTPSVQRCIGDHLIRILGSCARECAARQ